MKVQNWKNWLKWGLLAVLVGCGIFVRLDNIKTHFVDSDGVMVPVFILEYSQVQPIEHYRGLYSLENSELYNTLQGKTFRIFDNVGLGEELIKAKSHFTIALTSTVAPLQGFFVSSLIDREQNYEEVVFWSRLPSVIAGIAALFVCVAFFRSYAGGSPAFLLVPIALLTFSRENIIYSVQAQSYALIVLMVWTTLFYLCKALAWEKWTAFRFIGLGIFSVILILAHYQLVLLIPPLFTALFLDGIVRLKKNLFSAARWFLIPVCIILPVFLIIYFFFLSKYLGFVEGYWMAGPNGEFLFRLPEESSLVEHVYYSLKFFLHNGYLALNLVTSFLDESNPLYTFWAVLFSVLACLGLLRMGFSLFTKSEINRKWIALFIAIFFVEYIFQIVRGNFTLSPTRHTLVLVPFYVWLIVEGLSWLFSKIKKSQWVYGFDIFLSLVISGSFFLAYPQFKAGREDPISEEFIAEIVDEYDIQTIIVKHALLHPLLMPELRKDIAFISSLQAVPGASSNYVGIRNQEKIGNERLLIMTNHTPITDKFLNRLLTVVNHDLDLNHYFDESPKAYKTLFEYNILSDVEISSSNRTQNYVNGIRMKVFERREGLEDETSDL